MIKLSVVVSVILLIFGCEQPIDKNVIEQKNKIAIDQIAPKIDEPKRELKTNKIEKIPDLTFMSAEWTDLMPKDDLDALLNPPDYINEIAENSAEDQLNDNFNNSVNNTDIANQNNEDSAYHQALASTRVIAAINNIAIKIPAYIVPLEFDDEQRVTQFFMVPYFGACIHLPPPPPNQTIFVNYPQGFKLASLYDPYWVSGVITNSLVENDTAVAAYSMEVHALELYEEQGD